MASKKDVCKVCSGSSSARYWICCYGCQQWFHCQCLKMSRIQSKSAEKLDSFQCPDCVHSSQQDRSDASLTLIRAELQAIRTDLQNVILLRGDVKALDEKVSLFEACIAKKQSETSDKAIQCDLGVSPIVNNNFKKIVKADTGNASQPDPVLPSMISVKSFGNCQTSSQKRSKLSLKKLPPKADRLSQLHAHYDEMDQNDFKPTRR